VKIIKLPAINNSPPGGLMDRVFLAKFFEMEFFHITQKVGLCSGYQAAKGMLIWLRHHIIQHNQDFYGL
jgi:hypothetical protein